MTLSEIQDILAEKDDEDCDEISVAIEPPTEEATADTDCDSDASDDEVTCSTQHLPRRILLTNVLSNDKSSETVPMETNPPKKKLRKEKIIWHKNEANVDNIISGYEECDKDEFIAFGSILECIDHFWTDEWLDYICEQSKIYAHQKSLASDCMNRKNLRVFFGILILSGYNKLPNRRLYWSADEDVQNRLVMDSMRRDTFDQIMKCLHFADNMQITDDRFHKVRPIFHHLNKVMNIKKPSGEFVSVDEIMVPYYGRHGDKQYIRGKPVRFGFKLWGACTSSGTLLHVEPYCGSHTNVPDHGFGHGPNIVLEMVNRIEMEKGQHVVCDNYFGSIALLKELATKGIACTSTLREDRLGGAPLKSRKLRDKDIRGSIEEAFTGCVSVVKWKDNKVVSVGSNKMRAEPLQKAKRYDRIKKKYIDVDVPNSVNVYNKHMGGVDLFDQQVSVYRLRIRSKKWWWPLFAWSINAQVVNAWRHYREKEANISLLCFSRNLVITLLKTHGTGKKAPGPKYPSNIAQETVRFNGCQHWTARGDQTRSRCKQCGGRTPHICKMCKLPLHPDCMEAFHTKK